MTGAPLLKVLALPVLRAQAGKTAVAAAAAAGGGGGPHRFAYFSGPLVLPATAPEGAGPTAAGSGSGGDEGEDGVRATVASLLELPAVARLVAGNEGRRQWLEKAATQAVGMAERVRQHRYVLPVYERLMDAVHSREEVMKLADDALGQANAAARARREKKGGKKRGRAQQQEEGAGAAAPAAEEAEATDVEEEDAVLLEVELVFPEGRDPEQVKEDWKAFVHASEGHHATWKTRSMALLPVTAAFSLLPAPNVFMLWNAFRVYSHMKSNRGAEGLAKGLVQHHYSLKPSGELAAIFHDHKQQQQPGNHPHAHSGSHHADKKQAKGKGHDEEFEKRLAAFGRKYHIDDLPRLYRRWSD